MGGLSIWHILVVAVLVVLLFGRGKISDLMGDVAKGIKSFRKGMAEDEPEKPKSISDSSREPAPKETLRKGVVDEERERSMSAHDAPREPARKDNEHTDA